MLLGSLALAAGCGGDPSAADRDESGQRGEVSGTVTVLAAASLTEAFTELGAQFERRHPGTTVQFSFAASSELATQVTNGAPADVFASASPEPMSEVVDSGDTTDEPTVFARNRLAIAVPQDNPGDVRGLADFAREELTIALCAPEVPCGAAARTVFAAAGITAAADTLEPDVKAALTKVELGEVDAALVYRTDVRAAGDRVIGIDLPEATEADSDYPVMVLRGAPNPRGARAFVDLVLSNAGVAVLTAAGFERP